MPANRSARLIFSCCVVLVLLIIGNNAYRHHLERDLEIAIRNGDSNTAVALLNRGVYAGRRHDLTRLLSYVQDNAPETVCLLLQKGADPNGYIGEHPLVTAARFSPAAVKCLLEHGANVNATFSGYTALIQAAEARQTDTVRLLLEHGADPNNTNGHTPSALTIATQQGDRQIMELLLASLARLSSDKAQKPDGIGARNSHPYSPISGPLKLAVSNQRIDLVQLLLSKGASSADKSAALTEAMLDRDRSVVVANAPRRGVVSALIASNPQIDRRASIPLMSSGAVPVAPAVKAQPRIAVAALGMVRYLLQQGARPDNHSDEGLFAIHTARENHDAELLALLKPFGVGPTADQAEIEARNEEGQTPLLIAVANGDAEQARSLVAQGAKVNVADNTGRTPLLESIDHCPVLAPLLLARGANPNIVTSLKMIPLKTAVGSGNIDLVRQLIAHGANVNLAAPMGHTPLYYARRLKRADITAVLEKAGGREE